MSFLEFIFFTFCADWYLLKVRRDIINFLDEMKIMINKTSSVLWLDIYVFISLLMKLADIEWTMSHHKANYNLFIILLWKYSSSVPLFWYEVMHKEWMWNFYDDWFIYFYYFELKCLIYSIVKVTVEIKYAFISWQYIITNINSWCQIQITIVLKSNMDSWW